MLIFIAEFLPLQDKSSCKNFVSSSVSEYNVQGIMYEWPSNCFELYCDKYQSCLLVFCSCHVSMCFTCFNLIFYGKNVDLNLFDISARLSVLCAFMLDVEICFQCFESVVWSSRSTSAHSLNVCLYISDRQRAFGCYTRCAINTALCWESDVCEILALHNKWRHWALLTLM